MDEEWEYYNHALIPTTAPDVIPDTSWMKDNRKWKELAGGRHPLFARWVTDFDCQEETEWWYIIRNAPFELDDLEKKSQKHIKQALRKCICRRINASECVEDLYRVYEEAYIRYKNADNKVTYEQFVKECLNIDENMEYWGGYDLSDRMVGYVIVIVHENYAETSTAKFSTPYMNLRVSDALYYTILEYYLNQKGKRYISSGQRSINHVTNTQDYKIKTFGFRKAYCRLCIKYNPKITWLIYMLYPFRNILKIFSGHVLFHQLTAVLEMEEIVRKSKKDK